MSQKIRIKDIAQLAGVSSGTVDRVLHNRGNVSPTARKAIDAVLKQVGYRPNIHLAGISLRRNYKLAVAIPEFKRGEYWDSFYRGVLRAINVYENVRVECKFLYYDQFDLYSCRRTFDQVADDAPDAVIVSPTFRDETIYLTTRLEERAIPYVYVDSTIDGTYPLAFFASHPIKCGYLMGKLLDAVTPADAEHVLFHAIRVGDASANSTILRKQGFMKYLEEHNLSDRLHRIPFSAIDPKRNEELIGDYFERHPKVRGAVVLNSRVSVIASYFRKRKIKDVRLIGIDLTEDNVKEVNNGCVDFLLGQRPEQQGYMAIKLLIQYLIYGSKVQIENYMPLDIITRENLDLYSEFNEASYVIE